MTPPVEHRRDPKRERYDAVVVGSGPNGLAAAITLARAGLAVLVAEARATVGGGARSAELTLPGFVHDVCSAIHPMAVASPLLRALPLERHGLEWIEPPAALAHPLGGSEAVVLWRSLSRTCRDLGPDGAAHRRLYEPLLRAGSALLDDLLGPPRLPRHPLLAARFGLSALRSAQRLAHARYTSEAARALFLGCAAHAVLELHRPGTAAIGMTLTLAGHLAGWPLPRGGSQRIADALAAYFESLGGEIVTGVRVRSLEQLPAAHAVLFDVTPRELVTIAGDRLPGRYVKKLTRFRHGPGVFKVDWALDGPIPWTAHVCAEAGTVHVGGGPREILAAERTVASGGHPERPFVLLAQQSLFDSTRAPAGKHTGWAYCHVPHGSTVDMTTRIEAQIERFAPGFRERITARSTMGPAALEAYNANYVGGDITGGMNDLRQLLARPVAGPRPYSTPDPGLYLCSASTPPGGGVHGMCGYHAARAALRRSFGLEKTPSLLEGVDYRPDDGTASR